MSEERRKEPRHAVRLPTEVKFTSWNVFALIYTINISKGGMNLELAEEPQPGALLTIKITPPKGKELLIEGRVKHTTKVGKTWSTGVQLLDLDDAMRQEIERTIRAHGGMLTSPGLTPRK